MSAVYVLVEPPSKLKTHLFEGERGESASQSYSSQNKGKNCDANSMVLRVVRRLAFRISAAAC